MKQSIHQITFIGSSGSGKITLMSALANGNMNESIFKKRWILKESM